MNNGGYDLAPALERWTVFNAALAVVGAGVSLATQHLAPSLLVACASLIVLCVQNAKMAATLPNAVTAFRFGLLCAMLGTMPNDGAWIAATAFMVFALDGLDGWLARRFKQASVFGAQFDMEVDALVILLLSLQLVIHTGYGGWVLVAGALRYVYVLTRFLLGPRQVREPRSQFRRWIFSLLFTSMVVGCVPNFRAVGLPFLAVGVCAVSLGFAPDFYALFGPAQKN